MSVIDTSGTPRVSKIINIEKYRARLCVRSRNAVAGVVLSRERIMSVIMILLTVSEEDGVGT